MATFAYNKGMTDIFDGTIDLLTTTLKIMLVDASYVPDRADDAVTASGAGAAEIVATNYTGGWGGSGRKTLANKTVTEDDANDQVEFDNTVDLTWTAIGGATDDTITGAILIREGASNDTTSRLIAYYDVADVTTNGSDYQLVFDAEGLLKVQTVV
jgi:hypothetical protein